MIEFLRGTLISNTLGHVVVDVAGVGYGVDVPTPPGVSLPEPGQEIALHTYLYVQEQVLRLYGFFTQPEREIFEVLIGTSGIGPKTALGILSFMEIRSFANAILREELLTLTKIPGVGKKTAERLIIELRDKVTPFIAGQPERPTTPLGRKPAGLRDTEEALEALGCKPAVAERAAQRAWEILGEEASVPDLVREALKHRH